jgi:hypothetical protein
MIAMVPALRPVESLAAVPLWGSPFLLVSLSLLAFPLARLFLSASLLERPSPLVFLYQ